jgi:hypothetical protein
VNEKFLKLIIIGKMLNTEYSEIAPQSILNGYYQKDKKKVLARMWRYRAFLRLTFSLIYWRKVLSEELIA